MKVCVEVVDRTTLWNVRDDASYVEGTVRFLSGKSKLCDRVSSIELWKSSMEKYREVQNTRNRKFVKSLAYQPSAGTRMVVALEIYVLKITVVLDRRVILA